MKNEYLFFILYICIYAYNLKNNKQWRAILSRYVCVHDIDY